MRRFVRAILLPFVFAIPWEYSLDLGAPFGNIARIVGLILLLFAIPAVLHAGGIRNPGLLQWITLALFLWLCCSYFWSVTPSLTLVKIRGYFQEMMVVWIAWEFVDNEGTLRALLRMWLAGCWVLAILTIVNFASMDPGSGEQIRFAAVGQDPNDVARFLDLGFPIAALLLDGGGNWLGRALAGGYFPIGLLGVLLTASRGGFVAAVIALLGCGILILQRQPKWILPGASTAPLIVTLIWILVPAGTLARLGSIAEQIQNADLNQRLDIWSAGWRAFVQAPFCGHGAGSFVTAAGLAPIDTAHNTALSIAVEGGLVALVIAATIIAVALRSILGTGGAGRVALGTLMAVWFVSSLVGTVAESRTTWLLLAVVAVFQRLAEEDPEEVPILFSSGKAGISLRTAEQLK